MIDTTLLDDNWRQLIINIESDYPIFKTAGKLGISFFGGIIFEGDEVTLMMYLEKPKNATREDIIFLSNVAHKDMGEYIIITDSSKNFSELMVLGPALKIRSLILDTIHFISGKVSIYLRYLSSDERFITAALTYSATNIPNFIVEYLGKSSKFEEILWGFNKYSEISVVSMSMSKISNGKESIEQNNMEFIMEIKYEDKDEIYAVYHSETEISNEKIFKIKGQKNTYFGVVIDQELRNLLLYLTTTDVLTFRRVVNFKKGKYDLDFYMLKSTQKTFLKSVTSYLKANADSDLAITGIRSINDQNIVIPKG
ncbi:MAG: hypothetical protein ACYDAO_00555 [Thermoplasmataceae archaeon]